MQHKFVNWMVIQMNRKLLFIISLLLLTNTFVYPSAEESKGFDMPRSTPLMQAVEKQQISRVKALVSSNSEDIDTQNSMGQTALILSVTAHSGNKAIHVKFGIVRRLLASGANIELKDHFGNTALSLAEKEGLEGIAVLIKEHIRIRKSRQPNQCCSVQ